MDQKRVAGEKSTEYIKDGMILGLGTGSTAYYMIKKVGELIKNGMKIKAVATSKSTESLARELKIPLLSIDEVDRIDLAIDGVDEIDNEFNAIKGGGGALFREKIVASLANEVIWIMDESKLVDGIGEFPLPVEILPYGYKHVIKELQDYSLNPKIRMKEEEIFVTDNGNYIVDLHIGTPMNINDVYNKVNRITGVLETGLFINMCNRIIIGTNSGAKIINNSNSQNVKMEQFR
ncbi:MULTISPECIES: ribose-5-phosphate isomerase RpiA [Clostridium]|jgi:ribose-5-phosphate isomerase (EC 5.3.1.6)|uniref:Ribose-5-phosphate isomerase A n=2 Tax=Clostridium beijerinckii TaxID=1520 RepID=A0A0B5QFK6_CLOBE|nr:MULTISPECIES: ribose-5-phosphate isomerase RpiA [Clostridium]ABR34527.1 ribose 5-phosphate isomerase [Clostridium beijerinckii NCIMB 8052]AIU04620.1 ribose 5-phosphate isomerase [Clostridium beijerinckii ATCC 35702]AJG99730.1 ribose-5-phosphate isomerase [Clostridium beijerinckii]MBF7810847.1 ribose-5-phosphate isomerase RpiA [Clostridium beijerinckii]NOW91575.1 ribose 5-phosphate isomerase A [Clostridium beijerinckii]